MSTAEIFEAVMLVCFGLSWPINALKSWRSRTTKGKSLGFLIMIIIGYASGITGKLMSGGYSPYVMAVYIFNVSFVTLDLLLYFRNLTIDRRSLLTDSHIRS